MTEALPAIIAFLQVILIDVSLSGDNAIIIAMAAAGLPENQRRNAIGLGVSVAIAMRVVFAVGAVYLLDVPGLVLVGGILLGWVCWRMWRELRAAEALEQHHEPPPPKTLWQAAVQIAIADISMSLDNVLAVAGAAREHVYVMAAGLVIAIALMAVAATAIVGLLKRWPVLNYLSLAIIVYVSVRMIVDGVQGVLPLSIAAISQKR